MIININKDEIRLILEESEGYRIEFKESMTSIDKELVAFANSSLINVLPVFIFLY